MHCAKQILRKLRCDPENNLTLLAFPTPCQAMVLLASRFQEHISQPIQRLAAAATSVFLDSFQS